MPTTAPEPVSPQAAGSVMLDDLGTIRVTGADAQAFLNAQLSSDMPAPDADRSVLAAWCDAKGRALAVFRVLRLEAERFLLIAPKSLIAGLLPRLKMFVLRARVTVEDATDEIGLRGVFGEAHVSASDDPDALPWAPGTAVAIDGVTVLRMPGPDNRFLLAGAPHALADLALDMDTAPAAYAWPLADIRAGLPRIEPATQGEFLPQMLNLHWLDGIDFQKGCYPGQEVIARLHYRGRLKRRLYRAKTQAKPAPGDLIAGDGGAAEGTVIQAAAGAGGGCELLAVCRVDAADAALTVAGAPLTLLDLPYATDI